MPGKQLLCCFIWQKKVGVLVGIVFNYLVFKLAPVAERSEVPCSRGRVGLILALTVKRNGLDLDAVALKG